MKGIAASVSIATLVIISTLLVSGCLDSGSNDDTLDLVIVSIAPLENIIQRIVGPDVEVLVMVPENVDPHLYSPTPSQLIKVSKADVYFKIGSGLEFEETNMDTIIETNPDMLIVDLSWDLDVVSFEDHGAQHSHEEDDHEEDHEDGTDPHVWLDPLNMKKMVLTAVDVLTKEYPDLSDSLQNNTSSLTAELGGLYDGLRSKFEPHLGMEFMTYHPAWGYFADAFGLIQVAVEEDGKEPGPQGVADLIDQAKEHNITIFLVEPQFDTSTAQQIADATGGRVISANPMSADYIEALRELGINMTVE